VSIKAFKSTVTLGSTGEFYDVALEVTGANNCFILVMRTDGEHKNFPIQLNLSEADALKLAAAICGHLAKHKEEST